MQQRVRRRPTGYRAAWTTIDPGEDAAPEHDVRTVVLGACVLAEVVLDPSRRQRTSAESRSPERGRPDDVASQPVETVRPQEEGEFVAERAVLSAQEPERLVDAFRCEARVFEPHDGDERAASLPVLAQPGDGPLDPKGIGQQGAVDVKDRRMTEGLRDLPAWPEQQRPPEQSAR
jgi:hypothetical protein